ncbi:MAG: type IV secretion system protein TraC [Betaproteobacteria bacterium]
MDMSLPNRALAAIAEVWHDRILGKKPDHGKEPAPVQVSNRVLSGARGATIHDVAQSVHGIHNILTYDQYDPETGLFYNDNAIAFCFEVVPQTGADEDMTAKLTQLFTPIPPDYGVQWCLFGNSIADHMYEAYVDQRHIAADNGRTPEFFVELAKRRIAYVGRAKGMPLFPADNYTVKNIRLVFSVTKTGSHQDKRLRQELMELRQTLQAQLKTSALPAHAFDAGDLIRFVRPILDPHLLFSQDSFPAFDYDPSRSIKDQVTPFGHHVRVKNNEILFGLAPATDADPDERIAVRAFGVQQYPQKKELWEMANMIGSFFDDGLQYPCPFLICGGMFTLDPAKVEARAQLTAARAKQNAKSKMAEFQPELAMQAADWDIVLHQLNAGGAMTEIYHTLILFAPKTTIHRCAQVALNVWRSERFIIGTLDSLHLPLLYASLPMTFTNAVRQDLKKFRILSTKTTVNAVDMSPVIAEWRGAGDPVLMLFGRRGTPTFVDFYSNKQGNYNIFVAGVSGSGKSVTMNEIVSSYRGIGARVWVIDVGRSYKNLIGLQKGTFLEFTTSAPVCINPFSWVGVDEEISFKDELRLLKPMVGRMASPNDPLSEFQYALIGEAITAVWDDYGPDTNPTLVRDYLLKKVKNEHGEPERIAYELAKQLQPFTKEGIYGDYFNGRADIDLSGDMIGLELEELKAAPDLRRVVLFVLTSRIAHDMYLSRDRKKLCLVDEAWQLLGGDKETAEFIGEGYRRARKYNGIFCVGTQGIQDAYANAASEAAYNNADWKILLRQDRKSLDKLIEDGVVNFSPAVRRMLTSLRTEGGRYAEMLISSPNGDAVVRHIPDPFSLLMASSKAEDFNEVQALLAEGHSTLETLTIMLKRRGIDA